MSEMLDIRLCADLQAAALLLFDSSVVGRKRSAELKVDLIKEFETELKNKKTENQVGQVFRQGSTATACVPHSGCL